MNKKVVVRSPKAPGWSRATSIGSNSSSSSSNSSSSAIPSPPSSELCALIGFAYRLGSIVRNHDLSIVNNSDVRREAKLLMSLSCSSPIHTDGRGDNDKPTEETTMTTESSSSSSSAAAVSGRITPTHSVTSISSGCSRRDTFCFTCPSLSLNNPRGTSSTSTSTTTPGSMLSRTLKVDDKDAMRLSSEAMARNVIESFQKAMEWRIQSWVDSLSRVLVIKEMELKSVTGNKAMLQQELFYSNEALLVTALREIEGKVQVLEANTAFKVLNKVSHFDETGSALKKRRVGEQEDRTGLEEGDYVYDVIHVLEMQCSLNISTPAGNVHIDLNVPGKIKGSFFSSEDDSSDDKLTDVTIHLNTDMMASMIEKSSRIAVRASTEALLKGEYVTTDVGIDQVATANTPQVHHTTPKKTTTVAASPLQTRSPKRKVSEANIVSGIVVITPARNTSSSLSSFGESSDSDGDNKPVRLQIPNSFPSSKGKRSGKILQPQASRASSKKNNTTGSLDFAARLPPKKYLLHQKNAAVVTPLQTLVPQFIQREKGPRLPVLVEVACAAIKSRKKK